jgi:hypothetical protein
VIFIDEEPISVFKTYSALRQNQNQKFFESVAKQHFQKISGLFSRKLL